MRPFHSFLRSEAVSNSGKRFIFHWFMKYGCCLFHLLTPTSLVRPRPSTNGITGWKNRNKNREIGLAALWSSTDMLPTEIDFRPFFSLNNTRHKQKNQNKKKTADPLRRGRDGRIPQLLTVYLKTRGSCESSQLGLLCMCMGDRKTLLTAVHHFDCPA